MDAVYCDFEYRDDGRQLTLGCFWHPASNTKLAIDFRQPDATEKLAAVQVRFADAVWFSYAAHAEIACFLQAGLDVRPMQWVCLYTEAKQITGSHTSFYLRKGGLLSVLERFQVPTRGSVAAKEATRLLILSTDTYTPAEWDRIVDYCWSDIEPLPALWDAIQAVHASVGKPYQLCTAVFRAEYLKACALLESTSRGFPVDVALMERIYGNQKLLRRGLAERANKQYSAALFRWVPARDEYSFHFAALEGHIASLDFPVAWDRTPSGRLRMDADYLAEFAEQNEYFKPLQETKVLLDQLKTGDLREQVRSGFVKGVSLPFHTITGRNQPLTKRGFMLNLPPWLRYIVRPEPDHVLIGADWSQQEIVLAAALSGDLLLKAALDSGDVYTAIAKMAGAIPPDGSAATHPDQRATFKTVQLGIGYGMGAVSLGLRLYLDRLHSASPIGLDEATAQASDLLRWHKATFRAYWRFVHSEVAIAQRQGWIRAKDGWTLFADQHSRATMLGNFHMQANGAVILREAIKLLARHSNQIEFVCSLHDAIYVYCHADDAVTHENILRRCMEEATRIVMVNLEMPLQIKVDVKTYTHETGYASKKGAKTFAEMMGLLDHAGV